MTKIMLVANTDWFLFRYRLSLARFLRARGMQVTLVSPAGPYLAAFQKEGFHHLVWEVGRQSVTPWGEIKAIRDLTRILRREQPDLVHLHTVKPVLYGSLAARLAGVPRVVRSITGRGYVFLGNDRLARWLRPLVSLFYRLLLAGGSGRTIFENDTDRRYFLDRKLVRSSAALLIEGVGVDIACYTPRPEPAGMPVILLASRLLWDKGVGTLVEASHLLHKTNEVRVVLVGVPDEGNPASIPVETLQRWQAEKVVEWWGWQEDMPEVYSRCHIVTLPSLGEGVPTALLEAAACGRPIVTTDVPGCREVVADGINGILVPPADAPALAAGLEKLVRDRELRLRLGAAGRRRVEERFGDTVINAQTLEVYLSLLG